MFTKKRAEKRREYTKAWHRVVVNGWAIDRLIKTWLYSFEVFVTEYKTINGEWIEDKTNALWYRWNGKSDGNLCAVVRHSKRWVVDGIVFIEHEDAFKYLENRIFGKAAVALTEAFI